MSKEPTPLQDCYGARSFAFGIHSPLLRELEATSVNALVRRLGEPMAEMLLARILTGLLTGGSDLEKVKAHLDL